MEKKMPESHPTHVNDKHARRNLEDFMPDHWKLSKSGDFHSGIEYGDDWTCNIVEKKPDYFAVTGARFYIQSKSTEKELRKKARRLGMRCKVSTLNYLHSLNLPTVMHYYHRPSNTGYWMWLDEYYQREYRPAWETKDEIDVYIPIKTQNILNSKAFEVIRKEILSFHYLHHLQKQADIQTKIDPNYGYRFATDGIHTSVAIYAKHPQALELHPLDIEITLDEKANETFLNAIKWGQSAEFDAITSIGGVPEWLTGLSDVTSKTLVRVFPLQPEGHSHIQIEYLDYNGNQLFKSKLFELHLVQQGTHYHRYTGTSKAEPLTLTTIFDAITPSTKVSIGFDGNKLNVVKFSESRIEAAIDRPG